MAEAKNVVLRVEGNKLIIEVDLTQNYGPSSTGKTNVVATSGGFAKVANRDDVSFSLNVNAKIAR
jgi:hypothetical protein